MSATLLTDQQKEDINSEVARLRNYLQLLQYCRDREKRGQAFSPDATKVIVEFLTYVIYKYITYINIFKIITDMRALLVDIWRPFTSEQEQKWKEMKTELQKKTGGLGISDTERQEIVQAMGMGRGAWYACPNGHVYAIGDCHGAMQVRGRVVT